MENKLMMWTFSLYEKAAKKKGIKRFGFVKLSF